MNKILIIRLVLLYLLEMKTILCFFTATLKLIKVTASPDHAN